MICELEEAMALPAEADESCYRTAAMRESEDDGASPPGKGKNRRRLEYKKGWAWIVVSDRSVRIWISTSRGIAVFKGRFPDRVDAGTTHEAYVALGLRHTPYVVPRGGRGDDARWVRRLRYVQGQPRGLGAQDPRRRAPGRAGARPRPARQA